MTTSTTAFDSIGRDRTFVHRSADGRFTTVNANAAYLLDARSRGVSAEELAAEVSARGDAAVTAADIDRAYAKLDALLDGGSTAGIRRTRRFIRVPLLAEPVIRPIASVLSALFAPAVFATLFPAALLILAARLLTVRYTPSLGLDGPTAYAIFFASILVHEFGHAAASYRFGAPVRAIGFTVYFVIPALYSDVTEIWRLPRRQRAVVDIGGIYFQVVAGAAFAIGAWLTNSPPLTLACMFVAASCLFSLSPFFKSDGYWLLADLLGLVDLGKRPLHTLRYVVLRRGVPPEGLGAEVPLRTRFIVTAYCSLNVVITLVFFTFGVPRLVRSALALPARVHRVAEDFVQHQFNGWDVQSLFFGALAVFVVSSLAVTAARGVAGYAVRLRRE